MISTQVNGIWKAKSHSSEIRLDAAGHWLFVGNRGHDSLAVFAVTFEGETPKLRRAHVVTTGGACPRNFAVLESHIVVGCVEINQWSGAPDNSSLSYFSAMTWPRWFRRAVRDRHRHAIEQASRRWRDERAVKFDFHTGAGTRKAKYCGVCRARFDLAPPSTSNEGASRVVAMRRTIIILCWA